MFRERMRSVEPMTEMLKASATTTCRKMAPPGPDRGLPAPQPIATPAESRPAPSARVC